MNKVSIFTWPIKPFSRQKCLPIQPAYLLLIKCVRREIESTRSIGLSPAARSTIEHQHCTQNGLRNIISTRLSNFATRLRKAEAEGARNTLPPAQSETPAHKVIASDNVKVNYRFTDKKESHCKRTRLARPTRLIEAAYVHRKTNVHLDEQAAYKTVCE